MIEYGGVLIFMVISLVISIVLPLISYIIGIKKGDSEKLSVYECGFDPFGDSRQKFEIRFFFSSNTIYNFWFRNIIFIPLKFSIR